MNKFAPHFAAHNEPDMTEPGEQHWPLVEQLPDTHVTEPCNELLPLGQAWQTARLLKPTRPLVAVPAAHGTQLSLVVFQKRPAGQSQEQNLSIFECEVLHLVPPSDAK